MQNIIGPKKTTLTALPFNSHTPKPMDEHRVDFYLITNNYPPRYLIHVLPDTQDQTEKGRGGREPTKVR